MKARLTAVLTVLLLLPALATGAVTAPAAADEAAEELVMTVHRGQILGGARIEPKETKTRRFTGEIFETPRSIEPDAASQARTLDEAMARLYGTTKAGEAAPIIAGYATTDRPAMEKLLSDERILKANAALFDHFEGIDLIGRVDYHDHIIAIVAYRYPGGQRELTAFPFIREDGELRQSEALSADAGYKHIFIAAINGQFEQAD